MKNDYIENISIGIIIVISILVINMVVGCASLPVDKVDYVTRQEYEYGLMNEQRKDEMLAELIKSSARSDSEIRSELFERLRLLENKFEEYQQKVY